MAFVRKGYCCRCGECCGDTPHDLDHGWCKWLKDGNFCTVYNDLSNAFRQNVCAQWPRSPSEIEHCPSCTYYFEEVPDAPA